MAEQQRFKGVALPTVFGKITSWAESLLQRSKDHGAISAPTGDRRHKHLTEVQAEFTLYSAEVPPFLVLVLFL